MIKENISALIKNFIAGLSKEKKLGRHPKVSVTFNRITRVYSLRFESEGMASQTLDLSPEEFRMFKQKADEAKIAVIKK